MKKANVCRANAFVAMGTLFLGIFLSTSQAQKEEPPALIAARETYGRDFVRELAVVQLKYQRALEQYQRTFTRSGQLPAASEAKEELKRAKLWKSVPLVKGERTMNDPQLNKLLQNYENAAVKIYLPVVKRYTEDLESLKKKFANSGQLHASLAVDRELDQVKAGKSLPLEAGAKEYLSKFTKQEFEGWLVGKVVEFSGAVAGVTRITFREGSLIWDASNELSEVTYVYEITGSRKLLIDPREKRHTVEFALDLHSGTFSSDRGTYPISIYSEAEFGGTKS